MSLEYLVDEKSIDQTSVELTGWANPLARLREALEKDEFALYCQPVAAVEACGERFPMAGVLRHTVQQLAGGSRIPRFTINVSGQTLKDATFPVFAAAELRAAGVAMDAVMFELDESDVLARPESSASFAAAVKGYGGGVVIDSFCRRAVSFAPFNALRPDFVKVDGSLIRKLIASEAAQTKLKAVVRVAGALGIGVVAECVEEQDLLARLKALGVGFAQGFGVAKPQPIESFSAKP
jgi:EAL domain-containing protein (putative c-di-GMP-specific phosphodiesterase class I)